MKLAIGQARSNPFATRYVRPGAVPFIFPPGLDAAALVARLGEQHWRGAIIGPHGSGKSALLAALCAELTRIGRRVIRITLHDGQRRLRRPAQDPRIVVRASRPQEAAETAVPQVVAIDGYEQLNAWNRWLLARRCRHRGYGLLVTSHQETRLPELYRTEIDCELLERIVASLSAEQLISSEDVRRVFARHGQNAREALFALYDLHEVRARMAGAIVRVAPSAKAV